MFNRRTLLKSSAIAFVATPTLASQIFIKQRSCKNITTGFPTLDSTIGEIKQGSVIGFTSKNRCDAIALQKSVAENVARQHKTAYIRENRDGLSSNIDIISKYSSEYDYLNDISDSVPKRSLGFPVEKLRSLHYLRQICLSCNDNKNIYSFIIPSNCLSYHYCPSYIINIDDNEVKIVKNRYGSFCSFKVKYNPQTCTYSE